MFAYHIYRPNFVGDYILPLNQLDKISPEIATKAKEKYVGREHNQQRVVYDPETTINLDLGEKKLYWGDVSFFTLHNPQTVLAEFDRLEIPRKHGFKALKIPLERFSNKSFVWLSDSHDDREKIPPSECITLEQAQKQVDITRINPLTIVYLKWCKENQKMSANVRECATFIDS